MTSRYLWTVIPRRLGRPIPFDKILEAEAYLSYWGKGNGEHWARKYASEDNVAASEQGIVMPGMSFCIFPNIFQYARFG